jgi:hypothetical protein
MEYHSVGCGLDDLFHTQFDWIVAVKMTEGGIVALWQMAFPLPNF